MCVNTVNNFWEELETLPFSQSVRFGKEFPISYSLYLASPNILKNDEKSGIIAGTIIEGRNPFMTKEGAPLDDGKHRLCGGVFLTILLREKTTISRRDTALSNKEENKSERNLVLGLVRLMRPDHVCLNSGTLKVQTFNYKNCRGSSQPTEIPFHDINYCKSLDSRWGKLPDDDGEEKTLPTDAANNRYISLLIDAANLFNAFLLLGQEDYRTESARRLIGNLLTVITQDNTIPDEDSFFVSDDGTSIKKRIASCF